MDAIPEQRMIEEKKEKGESTDRSSATASYDSQELLGSIEKPSQKFEKAMAALTGAIPGQQPMKLKPEPGEATGGSQELGGSAVHRPHLQEETAEMARGGVPESMLRMHQTHLQEKGLKFEAPAMGAEVRINPIWSDTFDDTVGEIKVLVQLEKDNGLTVFLDTEFCRRGTSSRRKEPSSPDEHYDQTKETVNGGDLVQVGLVIRKNGNLELLGRGCYEFNLLFDASSRTFKEVEFLSGHLKLLGDHATKGIALDMFASFLRSSGLTSNEKVTWVTFQAYNDYGYVIRALEATEALPEKRIDFLRLVSEHFPTSYDLKVFHRLGICCVKPSQGVPGSDSLNALGAGLKVERDGQAHMAGSDAIFTMRCFQEMTLRDPPAFQPLRRYKGILQGVMDSVLSASYARNDSGESNVGIAHVWATNLSEESEVICGLFPLLGVIAVEIRSSVSRTGSSEVEVAISDARGWVAFDKVWVFHVHGHKDKGGSAVEEEIGSAMLAELLTRARAIVSESLTWLSSSGKTFRYLLDALTAAPVPPEKDKMFYKLLGAFFPNRFIVEPPEEAEGSGVGAVHTLRRFLQKGKEPAGNERGKGTF